MPVQSTADGTKIWRRRTSRAEWLHFLGWASLVLIVAVAWRVMTQDTIWAFVSDAPRQAGDIASRMLPPRWS